MRINIFQSVVIAALGCAVSNSAFAQNTSSFGDLNEAMFQEKIHEKGYNYDFVRVEVQDEAGNISDVTTEMRRNSGVYFGVHAGGDYFMNNFTPVAGVQLGSQFFIGKTELEFVGEADFGWSQYNERSEKAGEKYLMTNFKGDLGVRMIHWGKMHAQNEVWAFVGFGYKLRQDFNAFVLEDNDEYTLNQNVTVKGSTMTYSVGLKYAHKNWMKASNWYIKARGYIGNEYFLSGSEAKFGAEVTLGINFVLGKHTYNEKAIYSLFGDRSSYKQAKKNMRILKNY